MSSDHDPDGAGEPTLPERMDELMLELTTSCAAHPPTVRRQTELIRTAGSLYAEYVAASLREADAFAEKASNMRDGLYAVTRSLRDYLVRLDEALRRLAEHLGVAHVAHVVPEPSSSPRSPS